MNEKLFYLLQLAGGTFPTGGFSQSWGLETYVSEKKITNALQLSDFSRTYMDRVLENLEGPFYCAAYELAGEWQEDDLSELETQFLAMKLTSETRSAGVRTGKALMRIASDMLDDERLRRYYEKNKAAGISYPIAFGIICARLEIPKEEGLRALVFSSINSLMQSGIKLIPLGSTEALTLMNTLYASMEECVKRAMRKEIEDTENFSPGLDIASMRHEILPTRLYMS